MADQILDLLNGMGNTPGEVADFLRGQGVKGHRVQSGGCPVALYLRQTTGKVIYVCQTFIQQWGQDPWKPESRTLPPPQITSFVTNFDNGNYPDLIA